MIELSVVVPMYNEESSIEGLLRRVSTSIETVDGGAEILVVDDGSTDGSTELVRRLALPGCRLISLTRNGGKGAAVRHGISLAEGRFVLVQDADLEYDPSDIGPMLEAAYGESGLVAVYGSRTLGARSQLAGVRKKLRIWPGQGLPQWAFGIVLSMTYLLLTGRWISDLLTGYKLYPRSIFEQWSTQTDGFETDHEISMRLHCLHIPIIEVPISYVPRSRAEGKKIRSRDAFVALSTLVKFRRCCR